MSRALLALAAAGALAATPRGVRAQAGDSARFQGRVLHAGTLAPLPGADVTLPALHRHVTTDSAGRFRMFGLPASTQLVQIRSVGYALQQDTLTLTPGWEAVRTYTLVAHTPTLDTVRARAPGQQYLSPSLRAFEQRRLSHQGGYFISDSLFRTHESQTLSDLIQSHIPGVSWSYVNSRRVLVSGRKACRGLAFQHACSTKPDCFVAIYLDGVLYYNAKFADQNVLPPDMEKDFNVATLAGAEYYPGGASAPIDMHPDDDGCGSLWLWTRER